MKFKWRTAEIIRKMRRGCEYGVMAAADGVADTVKANISTPSPPASSVGAFPHKASGALHDSVVATSSGLVANVAAMADHAMVVDAERPFMLRSLLQHGGDQLADDFVRGFNASGALRK